MYGSPILQSFANARESQAPRVFLVQDSSDDDLPEIPIDQQLSPENEPERRRQRRCQNVVTLADRKKVLDWMETFVQEHDTETGLFASTARKFSQYFGATSYKANVEKASNWWKTRDTFCLKYSELTKSVSSLQNGVKRTIRRKSFNGRGRQRSDWVVWLYDILIDEFRRLTRAGLNVSNSLLLEMAQHLLYHSDHPIFIATYVCPRDKKQQPIVEKITTSWIQAFTVYFNLVIRKQTGKLSISPSKTAEIEREVAFHLGKLKRLFDSGDLNEYLVENFDETHFILNVDSGYTLAQRGQKEIKYADVVSGTVGFTMVVRLTGGAQGKLTPIFIIFQNASSSYPIRDVDDDMPLVGYRSSKKGWMTRKLLSQYFSNRKVYKRDRYNRQKIIFCDNAPCHMKNTEVDEALNSLKAKLVYLPKMQLI
ncbi:hypothetical protein GEMRC1_000268 [Eukaryota sp. GEM-RC1]